MYTLTRNEYKGWVIRYQRQVTASPLSTWSGYRGLSLANTRTGQKVPDYKAKIAAGTQAGSPFSLDASTFSVWDEGAISYSSRSPPGNPPVSYSETWSGMNDPKPSPVLLHLATSEAKATAIALKKTYDKVRSEYQHMNSPAVLAEIVDVLRQFGSPFRSIVDLTNRRLNRLELAKRGLSGSTAFKRIKWHEIVASTYLEWSFGLAPLLGDTKNAAEALARLHAESEGFLRHRAKVVGRGLDELKEVTGSTASRPVGCWYAMVDTKVSKTTECRVQYVVGLNDSLRADLGSNDRLLQLLGFDHANWIPGLWEAVPWSWLVDYFSNVQNILDASVTKTSAIAWINKTVTNRTELTMLQPVNVKATVAQDKADGRASTLVSGHAGRYTQVRTTMVRTQPASLGVPPLVFEVPSSAKKLANMAAVLISRRPSSSALWLF